MTRLSYTEQYRCRFSLHMKAAAPFAMNNPTKLTRKIFLMTCQASYRFYLKFTVKFRVTTAQ